MLEALAGLSIPRIVPTLDGRRHVLVDGRALHVFSACAGEIGAAWLLPGDTGRVRAAMTRLAELHRVLARVPAPAGCDTWLRERFARVEALDSIDLPRDAPEVLGRIEALLERTPGGPLQWLHGDYHLGNLLWGTGDTVASVVDFEDVACGSAVSEAVLALFALARQNQGEERFAWDRSLWEAGLAAYVEASGMDVPIQSPEQLEPLFCAYQVLIHLEAAAHRLWTLSPGIGFWPCWNRLMRTS